MRNSNYSGVSQLPRVHIREALDHFKAICGRDHKNHYVGAMQGEATCKRCIAERDKRMHAPGVRS